MKRAAAEPQSHYLQSIDSSSTCLPAAKGRFAYVHLVMKGDSYISGALVSAYSLRLTNTCHDTVCMVTDDVSDAGRSILRIVFDHVVEVPYINCVCRPMRGQKQQKMYDSWIDCAFTKWNALSLDQYEKIMFVDADKIVLSNIDHLFELQAPAATFSSPWAVPYAKRKADSRGQMYQGMSNPYRDLKHGEPIQHEQIEDGFYTDSFVCIGTMVLLQPSKQSYEGYKSMLEQHTKAKPFGIQSCYSMMDEQSLTLFYHSVKRLQFTYIHQQYNYIPWQRSWLAKDGSELPSVFHFFNSQSRLETMLLTRSGSMQTL